MRIIVIITTFTISAIIFTGCQKENNVMEETPVVTNFNEFSDYAGDRLVYSEELSNEEYDVYVYYYDDESIEPLKIAEPKEVADKDIYPPIVCDRSLDCFPGGYIYCLAGGNECASAGYSGIRVCSWMAIVRCWQQ